MSSGLGDVGETLFASLCAQSGILVNESSRDRAGWDAVVDVPLEDDRQMLDVRLDSITAFVQIKTSRSRERPRAALTAWKRWIDAPHPVFVFHVPGVMGLRATEAHLVHVTGELISRGLRRIRQASVSPDTKLHKAKMSVPAEFDVAIDIADGRSLLAAMRDAIGHEPGEYARRKTQLRDTIGFGDSRLELRGTIPERYNGDFDGMLTDLRLGELDEIVLEDGQIYHERFGISSSEPDISLPRGSTLRMERGEGAKAEVRVESASWSALLDARVFVAKPRPQGPYHVRAEFEGGSVSLAPSAEGVVQTHIDLALGDLPLAHAIPVAQLVRVLAGGEEARLTIFGIEESEVASRGVLTGLDIIPELHAEWSRRVLMLGDVLCHFALSPAYEVSVLNAITRAKPLEIAALAFAREATGMTITLGAAPSESTPVCAAVPIIFDLGREHAALAVSASGHAESGSIEVPVSEIEVVAYRVIRAGDPAGEDQLHLLEDEVFSARSDVPVFGIHSGRGLAPPDGTGESAT